MPRTTWERLGNVVTMGPSTDVVVDQTEATPYCRLTEAERAMFWSGACPDCQSPRLREGPCGGGSVNLTCMECGSRFNDIEPFGIERIR